MAAGVDSGRPARGSSVLLRGLSFLALLVVLCLVSLYAGQRLAVNSATAAASAKAGGAAHADDALTALNLAAKEMDRAGVALNVSQLLDFNRARLQAYLQSGSYARRRAEFRSRLAAQPPTHRRGIVIAAGGGSNFANAAVTVRVLRRHLKCPLPIEIVHFGPSERVPQLADLILAEATPNAPIWVVDGVSEEAKAAANEEHVRGVGPSTFAAKPFTLAYVTRFREVLLLDADNMPLSCPDALFDSEEFRRHGNLFWPDFWHSAWVKPAIYSRFGAQRAPWEGRPDFRLAESGQLLIDRLTNHDVLQWLWLLNSHTEEVYGAMHGDKDTYRLAFIAAGRPDAYQQVTVAARQALREVPGHKHRYHHLGAFQSASDGRPVFFHRTSFNAKFFPDCVRQPDPHYCEVQWFTIPISDKQASRSLKPNMYAYNEAEINSDLYKTACKAAAAATGQSSTRAAAAAAVIVPETGCDAAVLGLGTDKVPVPVLPAVRLGPAVNAVLNASYTAFRDVQTVAAAAVAAAGAPQ